MTAVDNPNYMLAAIRSMAKRPFRVSLGGLNPTGAGTTRTNHWGEEEYIGKCHRQNYYSKRGYARTNPPDDRSMVIFETGHSWEASMTEHFKRQGLLIDNNIKIKQDIAELAGVESDVPVWISGEVDQLLRKAELDADGNVLSISQTEAVIVDAKTIRGYGAREAMGNKEFRNGKAKDNYVMQMAVYLAMRKPFEDYYGVTISHAELHYAAVDSGLHKVFKVSLEDGYSGRVIVTDLENNPCKSDLVFCMEMEAKTGVPYAPLGDFTVEQIIQNYIEMQEELEQDEPPARTYPLRYSDEQLETMWARGQIAKTNWPKIQKDPLAGSDKVNGAGSWACNYCDFKDECYPFNTLTDAVEAGEITPAEAMEKLGFESL
jgi:hypothetical protein